VKRRTLKRRGVKRRTVQRTIAQRRGVKRRGDFLEVSSKSPEASSLESEESGESDAGRPGLHDLRWPWMRDAGAPGRDNMIDEGWLGGAARAAATARAASPAAGESYQRDCLAVAATTMR
jgi:hypothetical protein